MDSKLAAIMINNYISALSSALILDFSYCFLVVKSVAF